jgi:hypothetical protein
MKDSVKIAASGEGLILRQTKNKKASSVDNDFRKAGNESIKN